MWLFQVSWCPPCPSQRGYDRQLSASTPWRHHFRRTPISCQQGKLSGQEKFWCFTPESAEKDRVHFLPSPKATDPDLQAGLLTAKSIIAEGKKNKNKTKPQKNPTKKNPKTEQQINKKSIFLQLAQRPGLFWGCDCALRWCRDSVHCSRGGLGMGHQKLKYIYKYKSSTWEIHSTVEIQCNNWHAIQHIWDLGCALALLS